MSGVILHSVSNDHPAAYRHNFLHAQASVDTPDAGYKSAKFETDLLSTSRNMLRQSRLKTPGYNLGYRVRHLYSRFSCLQVINIVTKLLIKVQCKNV